MVRKKTENSFSGELELTKRWGENASRRSLTADQVIEIRAQLAHPRAGLQSALARHYGVSTSCIQHIKTGKNWACLLDGRGPR